MVLFKLNWLENWGRETGLNFSIKLVSEEMVASYLRLLVNFKVN